MSPATRRGETSNTRSTIIQALLRFVLAVSAALLISGAVEAQPAGPDDPFARRSWHLELGGHAAFEAWNYNISREEMYALRASLAYGIGRGIALTAGWPLYYVAQRGTNAYFQGATIGMRGRIYRRGRISAFLEFEVGVSEADTFVPPRGTRFNYLALGGAGLTTRVRPGLHLLTGLKWIHVSNNGLAGRSRNPDIEAIGPRVAVLIRF